MDLNGVNLLISVWSTLISIRQTDVDRSMIRTQSKGYG